MFIIFGELYFLEICTGNINIVYIMSSFSIDYKIEIDPRVRLDKLYVLQFLDVVTG